MQPLRAAVALPFLGLILFTRFLNPLKGIVLAALPMRYYHDLPEIPIVLYFGFTVLAVIIHRCGHICYCHAVCVLKEEMAEGSVQSSCAVNMVQ